MDLRVDIESAVLHLGRVPWYLPRRYCAIARGRRGYRSSRYECATYALEARVLSHLGGAT